MTSGMGCGKYARSTGVTQIRSWRLLGHAIAQNTIRKSPIGYRFVLYWVKRLPKRGCLVTQNTTRNNPRALAPLHEVGQNGLGQWVDQYFQHAVTTSPASQQVQRRDLALFLRYMVAEEGT